MQVTLTNLDSSPLPLGDLGSRSLAVGESITIERSASQLSAMRSVIAAVAAGKLTVTQTPTADELASGLLTPSQPVQAQDTAPVASSAVVGGIPFVIRKSFTALAAGTADDVEILPANALPRKLRVLMVFAVFSVTISATTAQLRTRAGGAGTLLATLSSADSPTLNTGVSAVATPGTLEGLFLRRGDRGVAGELIILCQAES